MKFIKAKTIDEYLASAQPDQRETLGQLRKTIQSIVPDAVECISYGIPAFRKNGRLLVAFGAFTDHCSFFPMSAATIRKLAVDLRKCKTSKGTIHFSNTKPLPVTLVKKILKARLAENALKEKR